MKGKKFFAFLLILWIVLGVWSFPYFLRLAILKVLQTRTGLTVFLSKVSFHPPDTFVLSDLRFVSKGKERLRVDQITLILRWKTLFSKTVLVEKVVVEDPVLSLRRHPDGSLDLIRFIKGRGEGETVQKRALLIQSFSLTRGEVTLWDEKIQKDPYPLHLSSLSLNAEELFFPPRDLESAVALQAFVGGGELPPSGSLKLKGWVNLKEGDFKFGTELREIDLITWSPYTAHLPMAIEHGRLDVDGELIVRQEQLWGYGLIHLRGLALKRTAATALFEKGFGISQEQLIAFLEGSNGELIFPLKVGGRLADPKFELGEMFTNSIRQSLARTLQKGVGEMVKVGSGTLGVADLETRAKKVVKEVEKTFRLDWLLTAPPQNAPKAPSEPATPSQTSSP